MTGEDELLTVKEAAARFRIHPETLRRWIRAGAVPCERVGPHGIIRLRTRDVAQVVRGGQEDTSSGTA